jgi:uncharacterized protein (TIGR02117 family)
MAALYGAVIPSRITADTSEKNRDILLVTGPIHYDLLLPLDQMSVTRFTPLAKTGIWLDHPDAEWLIVGWGAHDFYTRTPTYKDLDLRAIWRGITGDKSVLRFDIIGGLPADLPARRLKLTEKEYTTLLDSVWNTLVLGADALPVRIANAGYTRTDGFFASKDQFHLFRTCNVWIGERLRDAGVKFGLWTPMSMSVSLSFDLYHPK